jgi:predicted Zn-dependent protease
MLEVKHLFLVLLIFCSLSGCAANRPQVPIGTVPLAKESTSEDERYGQEVLRQLSEQYPISRNEDFIRRTRRIVEQLTDSRPDLSNAYWHVYVLEGDIMNAAATRGNFIFVWSKMLLEVEDDAQLAAVFAHEIGHILANHPMPNPAEQANQIITGVASAATREVLRTSPSVGPYAGLASAALEQVLGALIINPESQRKELEADHIGLFLMADAKFKPDAALKFWEKASNNPAFNGRTPEIFSSHPSSNRRVEAIRALLPQAHRRFLIKKNN